jgi:hypothetical protein
MEFDEQEKLHPNNLTSIPTGDTTDLVNIISEFVCDEYTTNNSWTEADAILTCRIKKEGTKCPEKSNKLEGRVFLKSWFAIMMD